MIVAELMEILENFDPDAEVRLATQKHWPFEYSIGEVVGAQSLSDDGDSDGPYVVYISEDTQLDYLSGDAKEALGW